MPLCKKTKNLCQICSKNVTKRSGLQSYGPCQEWAHFKCLNNTKWRIKNLKHKKEPHNNCPKCNKLAFLRLSYKSGLFSGCSYLDNPRCTNKECPSSVNYRFHKIDYSDSTLPTSRFKYDLVDEQHGYSYCKYCKSYSRYPYLRSCKDYHWNTYKTKQNKFSESKKLTDSSYSKTASSSEFEVPKSQPAKCKRCWLNLFCCCGRNNIKNSSCSISNTTNTSQLQDCTNKTYHLKRRFKNQSDKRHMWCTDSNTTYHDESSSDSDESVYQCSYCRYKRKCLHLPKYNRNVKEENQVSNVKLPNYCLCRWIINSKTNTVCVPGDKEWNSDSDITSRKTTDFLPKKYSGGDSRGIVSVPRASSFHTFKCSKRNCKAEAQTTSFNGLKFSKTPLKLTKNHRCKRSHCSYHRNHKRETTRNKLTSWLHKRIKIRNVKSSDSDCRCQLNLSEDKQYQQYTELEKSIESDEVSKSSIPKNIAGRNSVKNQGTSAVIFNTFGTSQHLPTKLLQDNTTCTLNHASTSPHKLSKKTDNFTVNLVQYPVCLK